MTIADGRDLICTLERVVRFRCLVPSLILHTYILFSP